MAAVSISDYSIVCLVELNLWNLWFYFLVMGSSDLFDSIMARAPRYITFS